MRAPGAHLGAHVAAEHPALRPLAQLVLDEAAVLDRRVAAAAARVDLAGRDDRVGGTGVDARRARAAGRDARGRGRGLQVDVEDHLGQEEPGADARYQEVGRLGRRADPARLRVATLQERRRVDERGTGRHDLRAEQASPQLLEPLADDVVVIATRGVAGDARAAREIPRRA